MPLCSSLAFVVLVVVVVVVRDDGNNIASSVCVRLRPELTSGAVLQLICNYPVNVRGGQNFIQRVSFIGANSINTGRCDYFQ